MALQWCVYDSNWLLRCPLTHLVAFHPNQVQLISGSNFGEISAPIAVTAAGPFGAVLTFASCVRAGAPTQIICDTPAGIGANLSLSLSVSGVNLASPTAGSAPLGTGIAYLPPVITSLVGVGSQNANTAGGQAVTITGANMGPASYANTSGPYIVVTYGGGTTGGLSFSAGSCFVTGDSSGSAMTCQTGPGIGALLSWQVVVGGQASNVLTAVSSYGAPTVSGFVGVGPANPASLYSDGSQSVIVQVSCLNRESDVMYW